MVSFKCEQCSTFEDRESLIGSPEPPARCESCGNDTFERIGDDSGERLRFRYATLAAIVTTGVFVFLSYGVDVLRPGTAPVVMNFGSGILFALTLRKRFYASRSVSAGQMIPTSGPKFQRASGAMLPYAGLCFLISLLWIIALYLS
jgi:hypothetical protein